MDANSSTHETPPNPPVAPTAEHPRPRRLVIPALVAAVALGVAGAGVGYAVGRGAQPDAANGSPQHGSTSTDFAPPGYDQGSGGDLADGFGGPPSQGGDPGLGTGPGTAPDGQQESGSTDTTGEASGDQLTGLVRIVSTMGFDGGAGVGTGMVLTSDGEVVTNHHVVEGATSDPGDRDVDRQDLHRRGRRHRRRRRRRRAAAGRRLRPGHRHARHRRRHRRRRGDRGRRRRAAPRST